MRIEYRGLRAIIISAALFVAVIFTPHHLFGAAVAHFERGCELYDLGRWVDARVELLNARNKLDNHSAYSTVKGDGSSLSSIQRHELDYKLVMCDIRLDRKDGIDQIFHFSENYPYTQYQNDILHTRSILEAMNGNIERAYALLQLVDKSDLDRESLNSYYTRMGYFAFYHQDYAKSRDYFRMVEEGSEYFPHALYFTSYMAYVNKDFSRARWGFEELSRNAQYSPLMPYYLLHIEFLEGNYEKAISFGVRVINRSTGNSMIGMLRVMAEASFRVGDQAAAVEYINRYIELGGAMGRSERYLRGFAMQVSGDYDGAIEELKSVCGPDDALTQNAAFHLANCYVHVGDRNSAMKAFSMAGNEALNRDIAEEALFNYAKLQIDLDSPNTDRTINIITRYIDTYGHNKKRVNIMHSLLIATYYNMRDYDTAYDRISRIENPNLDLQAAKQKITYLRALESYNAGDFDLCEDLLEESIRIGVTPEQISLANFWLGELAFDRGDYVTAINHYNYFVARTNPDDKMVADAHYSIAYALLMSGNKVSAQQYFERYLRDPMIVDRYKSDVYNRLGDIRYSNRDFVAANSYYNRAIGLRQGDDPNYARFQIAMISGLQNNSAEKLRLLTNIKSGRYADDALYERANTYVLTFDYKSAIKTYLTFIEQYKSSDLYIKALSGLGIAYSNVNDVANALKYYDIAIKSAPQSQVAIDALNGVRELYISRGEAKKYFDYAKSLGLDGDLDVAARDSLSFASARELYFTSNKGKSKDDYRSAARALSDYLVSYPKGYYLNDALFFAVDSYIKAGEPVEAIKRLTQLTRRDDNIYSERSYKLLAQLTYDQKMYVESAAANRKLYDLSEDQDVKESAMYQYASATISAGDEKAISAMIGDIMRLDEDRVGTAAFLEARFARATLLRLRGERKEALPLYEEIIMRSHSADRIGESQYYIVDYAVRLGNLNSAEQMVYDFSSANKSSSYWLAKSFLLLGEIYVKRGDSFQARATFQSILDGYSSTGDGIIEEARGKIRELK